MRQQFRDTTENDKAWRRYIEEKRIAFDQPSYPVDARELQRITQREARLLAKFDTPSQLPAPFREVGYTLVPTRNGHYAIVSGNLFVAPAPCITKATYQPQLAFPLLTAGRGDSEAQYIDYAFNIGLLSSFLNIDEMYLTIRGREYTRPFQFTLSGLNLDVSAVQIEVDAGYEARREIALIEAKIGTPTYFNVRQLYYPYRHFSSVVPSKRIRNVFLTYDIPNSTYYLYEYIFTDQLNPLSATSIRCAVYNVAPQTRLRIDDLLDVSYQTRNNIVPQADDLNKIFELLELVNAGVNRANDVADYFVFAVRQSSYYREAAEYLGLLRTAGTGEYEITDLGATVLSVPLDVQARALAKAVVNSWLFIELIDIASKRGRFTEADIDQLIASIRNTVGAQKYTSTTIGRRRQTILAWVSWLTDVIGCLTRVEGGYTLR